MAKEERTFKTLAIRLDEELHARLTVVAQLGELTITDAIRQAIDAYVTAQRSNTDLAAKAQAMLDDIDRDAAARRQAIQSMLGEPDDNKANEATVRPIRGRGKAAGESTDTP